MKKRICAVFLALTLFVPLLSLPSPVLASLAKGCSLQAVQELENWILEEKSETGGTRRLPAAPLRTFGHEKEFAKLLKKRLGDGKMVNGGWLYPRSFRSLKNAWIYAESLCYRYNPYIEIMFGIVTRRDERGTWYTPYLFDSRENYLIYKYKNRYVATLLKKFRRDFRQQLDSLAAVYRRQNRRLTEAAKAAAAANFLSARLQYQNKIVTYKNQHIYAGGSIRTALLTGQGNCYDYAFLFRELCDEAGLKCRMFGGPIQVDGEDRYHAWNAVRINYAYYFFDGTSCDDGSDTGVGNGYNSFVGRLSRLPVKYTVYVMFD